LQCLQVANAFQYIVRFDCHGHDISCIREEVCSELYKFLKRKLYLRSIKIGSFGSEMGENTPNQVMLLVFGKHVNTNGKNVQAQFRPHQIANTISAFTMTSTLGDSIKMRVLDGPSEDPGVQRVPHGYRTFEHHKWYEHLKNNLYFEKSTATEEEECAMGGADQEVSDEAFSASVADVGAEEVELQESSELLIGQIHEMENSLRHKRQRLSDHVLSERDSAIKRAEEVKTQIQGERDTMAERAEEAESQLAVEQAKLAVVQGERDTMIERAEEAEARMLEEAIKRAEVEGERDAMIELADQAEDDFATLEGERNYLVARVEEAEAKIKEVQGELDTTAAKWQKAIQYITELSNGGH
jgi:hypothetical protein